MFKSLVTEVLGVGSDPVESGASLREFEWKYRILVIIQDRTGTEASAQASRFLADRDALRERDLVLITVGEGTAQILFTPSEASSTVKLDAKAICQDLDVAPGIFHLALIGKDGTVKMSAETVVEAATIFSRIDQMPMRREEMRH